jgi:deoxyribonuclease-1-like protein
VPLYQQVKVCAWNIQNFGRSKSDSTIMYIAKTLKSCDVVAVVEVVAGNGGAQAVARLADELGRNGSEWDYSISDPTSSGTGGTERYAFIWKTARIKKHGDAWLDTAYRVEIEREPYLARFSTKGQQFIVAAFHAVPKEKQPEREIKFLKLFPARYSDSPMLFLGDFNCPQSHTVFNPLKSLGFAPALRDCRTSLRMQEKNGECLASEYDNIFYNTGKIELIGAGVINFHQDFNSLKGARRVSDHLPVFAEIDIKGSVMK